MPTGWNPPFEQQSNLVEAPEFIYPGNQEVLKRLENYNSLMVAARFSIFCIIDQFGGFRRLGSVVKIFINPPIKLR